MRRLQDYSHEELMFIASRLFETENAMQRELLEMLESGGSYTTDEYCSMVVDRLLDMETAKQQGKL